MSDEPGFEDMERAAEQSDDDGEFVEFENDGDTVVGNLREIKENVGKYDSRLYVLTNDDGEKLLMWGNGSINAQVDAAELSPGDRIGVKRDGTYSNEYGEYPNFDVRFSRIGEE